MQRGRLSSSCALACWLASLPALAFAQPHVLVLGKGARAAVVDELQRHSVNAETSDAADSELSSASGRMQLAREHDATALVVTDQERAGQKTRLSVAVYDARDGESLDSVTISAPKNGLAKQLRLRLWDAIGEAIGRARAAEREVAPEPVAQAQPEPALEQPHQPQQPTATQVDDEAAEPKSSPLDLSVGGRAGTRDFSYTDSLPGLRGYQLGVSPTVALHVHWYPAAHFMDGVAAQLGLDLRAEMLVGVSSKNSSGQTFATSSTNLGLGLRMRLPVGKSELGLLVGYGQHNFSVAAAKGVDPGVPDVAHSFLRAGADARWLFADPLSLQLSAAYLAGLGQGEIAGSAWFPHASGNGFEAEVGLGYSVAHSVELQAALALQRYILDLDPRPTDASVAFGQHRVAGGALDQFLSLRLAAVWRM